MHAAGHGIPVIRESSDIRGEADWSIDFHGLLSRREAVIVDHSVHDVTGSIRVVIS